MREEGREKGKGWRGKERGEGREKEKERRGR